MIDTPLATKISDFFAKYPKRSYEKGKVLIRPEENPTHVYYIHSGQVRQYDINAQGEEVVVNVFRNPAFFPMTWAINKSKNMYFYDCFTDVVMNAVPPNEALDFLKANPDVMFNLLGRVLDGASVLQRRMAHLMGGTGYTRVIFELLTEAKRFGIDGGSGAIELPIKEDELARRAGLSRETINRELSKLKTSGHVTVSHKKITVTSLKKLDELLDGDI